MSDQATEREARGKRAVMEEIIDVVDRLCENEAPLTEAEKQTFRKCALFTVFAFKMLPDAVTLAILETVVETGRRAKEKPTTH